MKIGPDTAVGEAASRSPRAARAFELLGIDYCCKGSMTIRDGGAVAGISAEEVVDVIEGSDVPRAIESARDWSSEDLPLVTTHIVAHYHRGARRGLIDLLEAISRAASGHASKLQKLWELRDAVQGLARDLIPHMRREEQLLFPYIDAMTRPVGNDESVRVPLFGTVEYPLQSIRHDHSDDLALLDQIQAIARSLDLASAACERLRGLEVTLIGFDDDLRRHIRLENEVLFPRAAALEKSIAQRAV